MGGEPFHSRSRRAARRIVVLANVIALLLAPLVVSLTHGPVVGKAATVAGLDMPDEIAAHGHAHGEAPCDSISFPIGGHDATDHEHQLQALLSQTASAQQLFSESGQGVRVDTLRQLNPDGPKRPPRTV